MFWIFLRIDPFPFVGELFDQAQAISLESMSQPTLDSEHNISTRNLATLEGFFHPFQSSAEVPNRGFAKIATRGPDAITDKSDADSRRPNHASFLVQLQPKRSRIFNRCGQSFLESRSIFVQENEIITVTNEATDAKVTGQEMIQTVEIEIREPLTRQIANGKSSLAIRSSIILRG